MKRLITALVAAVALSGAALAEDRGVALILGNGAYANAPDVANARADVDLLRARLKDSGYVIYSRTDATRQTMRDVLVAFHRRARSADRAVIYFTGQAFTDGTRSYLAPVDLRPTGPVEAAMDGVPLSIVLDAAAQARSGGAVFLNAAQISGVTPTDFIEPGLRNFSAPDDVLVATVIRPGYATRDPRNANVSSFARTVADRLAAPGARLMPALREAPGRMWTTGTVAPVFTITKEAPPVDPNVAAEKALNLSAVDKRAIQTDLTELGYDTRGIDGRFGPGTRRSITGWQESQGYEATSYLTRRQIAALSAQARIAKQARQEQERADEAARQEEARKRQAEDRLAEDAAWRLTRRIDSAPAYRAYLADYPNGAYAPDARRRLAALAPAAPRIARADQAAWDQARADDRIRAYRTYLRDHPQGAYRDQAAARIDELANARNAEREADWRAAERANTVASWQAYADKWRRHDSAAEALARIEALEARQNARAWRAREQALNLTANDVLSLEQRLFALNYPPGRRDGRIDEATRNALSRFEGDHNLRVTGYFNQENVQAIVARTQNLRRELTAPEAIGRVLRLLNQN